jgi:dTDP-4-amino-4,6-dideoxygalactose transaminase
VALDQRRSNTTVPFLDLNQVHERLTESILADIAELIGGSAFVNGRQVAEFESAFAAYCGIPYCVGVSSGLDALRLAILAADGERGDEVIVPAMTFAATFEAVTQAGCRPVVVDVTETDYTLDVAGCEAALTARTRFLLPVHLYGQMADMRTLAEIATSRGLGVIEDACQAHGARRDGLTAGAVGLAGGFSFYPSKNLGALGDGGMVCTSDPALAERARQLRNLGQREKGGHLMAGYNERLDTLQAALLRVKLPHLDRWNELRREAAGRYRQHLPPGLGTLPERDGAGDVYHLFPIRVREREEVRQALAERGVEARRYYAPPVHLQPPFRREGERPELPVAEAWGRDQLCLPMFPELRGPEILRVCEALAAGTRSG